MRRYLTLFWTQLRASLLLAMQYRYDFLIDGAISLFSVFPVVLPIFVIFQGRADIVGWTLPQALLVTGWFVTLDAIIDGAISPSLTAVVDHIRKGTLDFVLLKPADAQFLVSTNQFQPWRITHLFAAVGIFVYAFTQMGHWPSLLGVLTSLVLLGLSTLLLYSLWILTVAAAFYVVKVDNLSYLFQSIFDAARWPASVFKGAVKFVFTFVIPLALMTTYPAEALLGRLTPLQFGGSLVGALTFAAFARVVWLRAIGKYTSASS
ncbi:MAG: ABC-2 family transporter protein [Myxococcota bacterium]|nr:ABC-2 family transporter protein [Myxococcota bacterium]